MDLHASFSLRNVKCTQSSLKCCDLILHSFKCVHFDIVFSSCVQLVVLAKVLTVVHCLIKVLSDHAFAVPLHERPDLYRDSGFSVHC